MVLRLVERKAALWVESMAEKMVAKMVEKSVEH
jgi:hypothetical protein